MSKYFLILFILNCFTVIFIIACKTPVTSCIDPEKIDKEALCTMQYDPVCGCNGQTYANACLADNAGLTTYTKGACK